MLVRWGFQDGCVPSYGCALRVYVAMGVKMDVYVAMGVRLVCQDGCVRSYECRGKS